MPSPGTALIDRTRSPAQSSLTCGEGTKSIDSGRRAGWQSEFQIGPGMVSIVWNSVSPGGNTCVHRRRLCVRLLSSCRVSGCAASVKGCVSAVGQEGGEGGALTSCMAVVVGGGGGVRSQDQRQTKHNQHICKRTGQNQRDRPGYPRRLLRCGVALASSYTAHNPSTPSTPYPPPPPFPFLHLYVL